MSERYSDFGKFMMDVVVASNKICDLNSIFEVHCFDVMEIISKLLSQGWGVFLAVVIFISTGAGFLGLGSLLAGPIGWLIFLALGTAAAVSIKKLYRDRKLPLAIKETGERYKPLYKDILKKYASTDYSKLNLEVDKLLAEAAGTLISKAQTLSEKAKEEACEELKRRMIERDFWN